MDDLLEKVLKGLGCCIQQGVEDVYCRELDCLYKSDSDSCRLNCWIQLLMDAVSMLKAQEALKPVQNEEKYGDALPHCPLCEKPLPNKAIYGKSYFCYHCGQAVKWK